MRTTLEPSGSTRGRPAGSTIAEPPAFAMSASMGCPSPSWMNTSEDLCRM